MLTHPSREWRIQKLADEANVSVGQVFNVKELLLGQEWAGESEQGISLARPRELLTDWAEHYNVAKHQAAQFYTLTDLLVFEEMLSEACAKSGIPCAFTSFAAASRYTPYAAYQRTTAYIHHNLPEVMDILMSPPLDLVQVESGANVQLLSPYDDGVFYGARQYHGVSLASPIQTYLDLQITNGRGREAADMILQHEIGLV